MPPHSLDATASPSYRALLAGREFAGLYLSFALTTAATTVSAFAVGTLVHTATGSPLLTALAMYGPTLAMVLGALTLMSVADGQHPRRMLLALQSLFVAGLGLQAWAGLPLVGRFAVLLLLGFVQSLNTGVRMGLLSEVVGPGNYALARSLMNITAGGMQILGYTAGGLLLHSWTPRNVFVLSTILAGSSLLIIATTIRERSVRITRRPGLSATTAMNRALFSHDGVRALLVNLWVPNGLIVGCEALLLSYDSTNAGTILAAGSAGMLLGDLTVGRALDARQRRRLAYPLRLLLATPIVGFVTHPPTVIACVLMFLSSVGFAATLPLQERLLELSPEEVQGQVQGVESAGRMTWQGLGAVIGGVVALGFTPAQSMGLLAVVSLITMLATRRAVEHSHPWMPRAQTDPTLGGAP